MKIPLHHSLNEINAFPYTVWINAACGIESLPGDLTDTTKSYLLRCAVKRARQILEQGNWSEQCIKASTPLVEKMKAFIKNGRGPATNEPADIELVSLLTSMHSGRSKAPIDAHTMTAGLNPEPINITQEWT